MSGPITVAFSFGPLGAVILAAEAIREAGAASQEYETVLARAKEREAAMADARRVQRDAANQRQIKLLARTERLERRLERLQETGRALAEHLPRVSNFLAPDSLLQPHGDDPESLARHAAALEIEIARLERLLAESGADFAQRQQSAFEGNGSPIEDNELARVLDAYVYRRSLLPGLSLEQAEAFRQTAARILGRLELPEGASVPPGLERLARDIVLAPTQERAEAIAAELRLGVQTWIGQQTRRQQDARDAAALLNALPDDPPEAMRRELQRAAAGLVPLAEETRHAAESLLAAAHDARARLEQEAAARVLEQSLRDLGYEVEGVDHTLFVEGGVVHFQRKGWDDYFIRMRLDPDERSLNFNVVRAAGGEASAERRKRDVLAEDRWCSEFPLLMKTLAVRGITLEVTRQLGAGELPVQLVDPAGLPTTRGEGHRVPARPALLDQRRNAT